MVAQIYECAKKRSENYGKRTGNGGREKKTHEIKKVFTDHKEIEDLFDQAFAELYPGEPVDPETEDLDDDPSIVWPIPGEKPEVRKRAYPYEFEGWREVGVNTYCLEPVLISANNSNITIVITPISALINKLTSS